MYMNDVADRFPVFPERINGLAHIAGNLSWSWNRGARALFGALDQPLWRRSRHNPVALLRQVTSERGIRLAF